MKYKTIDNFINSEKQLILLNQKITKINTFNFFFLNEEKKIKIKKKLMNINFFLTSTDMF